MQARICKNAKTHCKYDITMGQADSENEIILFGYCQLYKGMLIVYKYFEKIDSP